MAARSVLTLLLIGLLHNLQPAAAQLLLEESIPQVSAAQQRSMHRFRFRARFSELAGNVQLKLPPGVSQNTDLPLPSYLFTSPEAREQEAAGTYDGLPRCEKAQLRYSPLFPDDEAFKEMDIVVYQFDNSEQQRLAKRSERFAFPYIEGALVNPYRDPSDKIQGRLRLLGLECLPTAVRKVEKDGKEMLEYREGGLAFN